MPVIVLTLEDSGQPFALDCCDDRYSPEIRARHDRPHVALRDHKTGELIRIQETQEEIDAILAQAHAADGELRARKQR